MKIKKLVSGTLLMLLLSACSNTDNIKDVDRRMDDGFTTIDVVTEGKPNNTLEVNEDKKPSVITSSNDELDEEVKEDINTSINKEEVIDIDTTSDKEELIDINTSIDKEELIDINTTSDEEVLIDIDTTSGENEDLNTTIEEKDDEYNYTEEEMIQFLCYNNGAYSNWYESNYVLVFQKDGIFSCYNASAGNPWLLQYGDTVEGNATYAIDTINKQIIVKDYDKDIIISYTIVSKNEIEVKIEGIDEIFHFSKRK